jgi:hypothetical protein
MDVLDASDGSDTLVPGLRAWSGITGWRFEVLFGAPSKAPLPRGVRRSKPLRLEPAASTPGDREWLNFLSRRYPRWEDFLALRAERDPNNSFLTDYWRDRLGLRDLPQSKPT